MSRNHPQQSAAKLGAPAGAAKGQLLPEEAGRVREMIAGRHSKAALQSAKDLHKRNATAESESLLVEAYRARIEDLIRLKMTVEAKALIAIVRQRFPAAAPQLKDLEEELCVLDGRLDAIVEPLGDPALAPEERERVEDFVRRRMDDLSALAQVASLPAEHPLRNAASALMVAFQAVTEGPIDDLPELAQIPRRSPLASWKALVWAISCYYREQDAACRKWLAAISRDSIPARLIRPLTAMLGESSLDSFNPAERRLIAAAGDRGVALRSSLAMLEAAFATSEIQPILNAVRAFSVASIHIDAALRERLRQHIAVRCMLQQIPRQAVDKAMGGPPKLDAHFHRLLARSLEEERYPESRAEAVIVWEVFRRAAIDEKWFVAGGLEDGVLSLHLAETVSRLPPDLVAEMDRRVASFDKANPGATTGGLPLPETLYERACRADPSKEGFEAWLRWAKKQQDGKVADNVAERWRQERPGEIGPLLHLMESAETRNSLKKALTYLEEAEELDRLNPVVRRAKLRLRISAALRHLGERKTRLVRGDIEHLLAAQDLGSGDTAALVAALRWCCGVVDKDTVSQDKYENELVDLVGPVAAFLLSSAFIGALPRRTNNPIRPLDVKRTKPEDLLAGVLRACSLSDRVGLSVPLRFPWTCNLLGALQRPHGSVDVAQLLVLGEAALHDSVDDLAYAVSGAAWALGDANAQSLFLRARSFPVWVDVRREACLRASLELARSERDTELTGKILDDLGRWFGPNTATIPLPSELLTVILEEEMKLKKFPTARREDQPRYAEQLASLDQGPCDCPECRSKRGKRVEDWEEEEEEFDISVAMASMLDLLPSEQKENILRSLERGEDPLKVLDQIDAAFRKMSPGSESRASKRKPLRQKASHKGDKKRKDTVLEESPQQSSLF